MKAELVLGNLKREREGLNNKLERLEQSLAKDWQDADQEYLCTQQYNAMSLYAHILDERIIDIECKLAEKKEQMKECLRHESNHEDKEVFKENVDLGSYKNITNTTASATCNGDCDKCCENEDITITVRQLLDDIFNIFNEE